MRLFIIIFLMACCANTAVCQIKPAVSAFILGEVHELNSAILHEKRTLNVYLPAGYNASDSSHYPVVYLLDGGAEEDFIHVAGLIQFNSFEWVHRLPKCILVGIANTNRLRDFTFPSSVTEEKNKYPQSGHSNNFISFIENELQPFINKQFKTTKESTLIGESLGGLLATEILLKKPALFNNYIIVSPSLWWNNGSMLKDDFLISEMKLARPATVYLAVGKEGLTPSTPPRVMEVDVNLLAEKINDARSKAITMFFDYLPQENHATIMHQALMNAFLKLSIR